MTVAVVFPPERGLADRSTVQRTLGMQFDDARRAHDDGSCGIGETLILGDRRGDVRIGRGGVRKFDTYPRRHLYPTETIIIVTHASPRII